MYQKLSDQGGRPLNNRNDSNIELEENTATHIRTSSKPDNDNEHKIPLYSQSQSQSDEANKTSSSSFTLTGDHMTPLQTVQIAIQTGYKKALSTSFKKSKPLKVFLSAILSGSYLGFAITLTIQATSKGWDKVSASLLFPFGFLLLILSGNSLATGNFALLPMALLNRYIGSGSDSSKKVGGDMTCSALLINWLIVYLGNFVGTLLCLFILWGGMTHFGHRDEDGYYAFKESLCGVVYGKVITYRTTGGGAGWFAALFNGMLANWLVTLAVILSISSKSTIGKVISVYLPISIFVALGFEHAIVNLFVLPGGLLYKCDSYGEHEYHYGFGDWWLWNQIPVTMGNIIGGATLTGLMYYAIYSHKL